MHDLTLESGIGFMCTLLKVALDVHTLKSGMACMFTLSKVGLDVWSHFQKWDWMYGHTFKSWIGCSHFQK